MEPIAAFVACFLSSSLGWADECRPPWRELNHKGYSAAVVCAVVADASGPQIEQFCLHGRECDGVAVHRDGRRLYFCTSPDGSIRQSPVS